MNAIELKNVSKRYKKKEALKNVNLEVGRGKIVGLLGKNGAGKTTLIKIINDLLVPSEGEVKIFGEAPGVGSKKRISYLPERTYLDRQISVREAVKMFGDYYEDFSVKKAKQLLDDLDLDEEQKLAKMSKGMQEKVQLVLVMARNAEIYILDEPLGGVDPATRDYILDTILSNFNKKASVIISTHLIADIERELDEVVFIDKGKIILHEDADKMRKREHASVDETFRRMFRNVK